MSIYELIEISIRQKQAKFTRDGALIVDTGAFTGRAADRRFICDRPELKHTIAWGDVNRPISLEFTQGLKSALEEYFAEKQIFSFEGFAGGFTVHFQSPSSWHALFAHQIFRAFPAPGFGDHSNGRPIEILHAPYSKVSDFGFEAPSETAIILDPIGRTILIVGTAYAGEIKKSIFSICNYLCPEFGILSMHASANCKADGSDSCLIFGLSGTGKTTLSASPDRFLIGDDEIIWGPNGLSNLEGGCYAKLINLSEKHEPEIYRASNRFGTIMENVAFHEETRLPDFSSSHRTENTRACYPLTALEKVFDQRKEASPPKNIVFLTADAFGAMPAVARLTSWQAQYYFISGYTAKVAGTEQGVTEPKATFSNCFGAPFMLRPAQVYADLLKKYAEKNGSQIWLLNTGWPKGYGAGERFPINVSRTILSQIQSGALNKVEMVEHPVFHFQVPVTCPGVDPEWLKTSTRDSSRQLARKFQENILKFHLSNENILSHGGPH